MILLSMILLKKLAAAENASAWSRAQKFPKIDFLFHELRLNRPSLLP
jgi:hypothetical protein